MGKSEAQLGLWVFGVVLALGDFTERIHHAFV